MAWLERLTGRAAWPVSWLSRLAGPRGRVEEADTAMPVTFYWRPGCPFCAQLRRHLLRIGLPFRPVNIWEDPEAAARVRQITGGDETVPTVVAGDRAMVNPSIQEVLEAVRATGG